MQNDCVILNELLTIFTAVTAFLFGFSEWLGLSNNKNKSVTAWSRCKCLFIKDVVVATVSPRSSLDEPRPVRKSCDMQKVRDLAKIMEEG